MPKPERSSQKASFGNGHIVFVVGLIIGLASIVSPSLGTVWITTLGTFICIVGITLIAIGERRAGLKFRAAISWIIAVLLSAVLVALLVALDQIY